MKEPSTPSFSPPYKGGETIWCFGRQVALQILRSELKVKRILVGENADRKHLQELLTLAKQRNISVDYVPSNQLDFLCKGRGRPVIGNHQGVALEMPAEVPADFKSFIKTSEPMKNNFIVLLDEIQDPQNLGAIIRSAVCFGCSAMILPKWRSAHLTPGAMKSSSGAAAHLPILQVSNLSYAIEQLKEKGYTIVGATVDGCALSEVKFEFPLALILGNEHRGIKPLLKKNCDQLVSIPQTATVASLNVSNAAAILFYEISKKRDKG